MYDAEIAERHVGFLEALYLTGDFFGRLWTLLPWQREVVSEVYGTIREDGLRQYRYAYLEIPKKNGKTELIAGLAIDHLVNDPPGGEIYCCAAEREQASLVYKAAKSKIEQEPYLNSREGGILKVTDSTKEIVNLETGSRLKVLSAEAYSKHGLNPTVVIFDELHAQPNRDLWDVMTMGSGSARKQPLFWVITTAGDDPDRKSIGWEIHEKAMKIRDGKLDEPTWYVRVYGAPEDADIFDEGVWYAANPSLGTTISIETLRDEARNARYSEANEKLFRWLRLNQWIQLKRIGWLPQSAWDKTERDVTEAELRGRECVVGIDLSSKIDLSAAVPLFAPRKDGEPWVFRMEAWIPEESMKERSRRDHVPYEEWVAAGDMHATPGNVIDYAYIAADLERMEATYRILHYCADPWHLEILRQLLPQEISRKFIEIPQTMSGMSQGMGRLEELFLGGGIEHGHIPFGRWSFGNVAIATDGNENKKPMKNRSVDRIDPVVALINAMAGAMKITQRPSVYETRGIRML